MSPVLLLLGIALIVMGATALYSGSLVFTAERGWMMVISGSVVASAGTILVGIAGVLRRLRQIRKELQRIGTTLNAGLEDAAVGPPAIAPIPGQPTSAAAAAERLSAHMRPRSAEPPLPVALAEPAASAPQPPSSEKVVGTYSAGGNSYVMYEDGSIRADTATGEHRFRSMDEFKAFMLKGALEGHSSPAPADPAEARGP